MDRRVELGVIEKEWSRAGLEIHLDADMPRQEAAEARQQPLGRECRNDGEIDGQSAPLMGHDGQGIAFHRVELLGHLPAIQHAGLGKPDPLTRAPEKLDAQKILEPADLPTYRAL